jgi:hypothetical protein
MLRLLFTEVLKGCVKFSPDDRECKSLHFEPVSVAIGYQQNLSTLQSKSDRQLSP